MFAPSHIELSRSALQQNIDFFRALIGAEVTFCSVIKGNAYGHGIEEFVPMAEACGVQYFGVFSADEALLAHQSKTTAKTHIMIMGMLGNDHISWAITHEVSFYVFELNRLRVAIDKAKKVGKPARIHLDLETGMNRIGLESEALKEAIDIITLNKKWLTVEGICTHYAGAESIENDERVRQQISDYTLYCRYLEEKGIKARYHHSACSAATLNYPQTIGNMVRVGIAQYGYWPNRETRMRYLNAQNYDVAANGDPLKRVMSWKSSVMSTKDVPSGAYIGYGKVYKTARPQEIATVPIGYSHGFKRKLTNVGIVLINGARAPVAGLVNMNLLTVDVTDIESVNKGDEVVIIGRQGEDEISVASFSEMTNDMNYEVLVQIPSRLPRKVVE